MPQGTPLRLPRQPRDMWGMPCPELIVFSIGMDVTSR